MGSIGEAGVGAGKVYTTVSASIVSASHTGCGMQFHALGGLNLVNGHAHSRVIDGGTFGAPASPSRRGGPPADKCLRIVAPCDDRTESATAAPVSGPGLPGLETPVNTGEGLPTRGLRRAWARAAQAISPARRKGATADAENDLHGTLGLGQRVAPAHDGLRRQGGLGSVAALGGKGGAQLRLHRDF